MRILRLAPPALLIGTLFGFSGDLAYLFRHLSGEGPWPARWSLYSTGAGFVENAMLAYGLAELSRRMEGRARTATRIAAAMFSVMFFWSLVRDAVVMHSGPSTAAAIWDASRIGGGALYTAAIVLLATASNGWRRAPAIAILGIAALFLRGWLPVIGPALQQALFSDRTVATLVLTAVGPVPGIAIALLAALVVRSTPDPIADRSRFADGLRLAARSIQFRMLGAVVIALVSVSMMKSGGPGTMKFVMVVGPAVLLLSMIACASGLHLAAQSRLEGVPVVRLCLGAAATLWWVGVQSYQLTWMYRALTVEGERRFALAVIEPWSTSGPVIAMGGLVLVGTGIVSFATARGDAALRQSAWTRTLVCVLLFAASIAMQPQLMKATSLSSFLSMLVALTALAVGSLVAISSLFSRAAASLGELPAIPEARVVSRDDASSAS
ncbi:MAG: hypothetical protein ACTHU0_32890 [Kofleriaceae bacterium]